MTDDRDFTSYVAARWTPLVRSLVALGAPLAAAHRSAAETLSRCHDAWDERDAWVDLDVHVFQDLVNRWEHRRDAWWERPSGDDEIEALTEAGWPGVEAELDRIDVPDRKALVLQAVGGLNEAQVLDVARADGVPSNPALAADLHDVLEMLPVDQPPLAEMIAASQQRRGRRRAFSIAAGVAVVAVAGVVTALVLRYDPPSDQEPETFDPVASRTYDNPSPLAWYGAGTLYLPHSQVDLRDVREFAQWDDGAVYFDLRSNLVTVTKDGARDRIATLGPDSSFFVSDTEDEVVWVDSEGPELVDYDLDTGERRLELDLEGARARIVSLQDRTAYVASGEQLLSVDLDAGTVDEVPDWRLPGELDRDGAFALTQEGAGAATARIRLYDTDTDRPVPLDIDEPRSVTAAALRAGRLGGAHPRAARSAGVGAASLRLAVRRVRAGRVVPGRRCGLPAPSLATRLAPCRSTSISSAGSSTRAPRRAIAPAPAPAACSATRCGSTWPPASRSSRPRRSTPGRCSPSCCGSSEATPT